GARRRTLNIPGEETYNGKGVAYCSTCDAPLFSGRDVAVVGGGNAGLEAVVDLVPYASKIYLLEYSDALKGDPVTQGEIKKSEKVEIVFNAETKEVKGEQFVTGLVYKDRKLDEEKMLAVQGVFVEIGSVPNSEFVKDLVELNKAGEILIDHKTAATSCEGLFAAGDVTDEMYKQNNISAGDGVKAALSAYQYLLSKH
ncbi:MAG: alkyl hydroperoxide reductase subunit F, partial [Parcubacteria group bacterium Gr01-1014_70]